MQENKEAIQQAIQHNEPDWSQLSESCADFVQLCLCKNARQRPTAAQLQLHSWLRPYTTHRPSSYRSLSVRPPSRTPNGIQTVLEPRRPPTPPTPVDTSAQCMGASYGSMAVGPAVPIATPGLTISALESQHADGTSSHCKHSSMHGNSDGMSSPMSTMQTYSSSPDVSGIMSGLKGETSGLHASHASTGLDTNSESIGMEPQSSHVSSSCMSTVFGQGCMHAEQTSAVVDMTAPKTLVSQSSELNCMHVTDSKSALSRETSALDQAFSTVSGTTLPPLHAPLAFTSASTDAY